MRNTDSTLCFLNVLTAGARCTEDVHGEVGGVDLDFDRVVDFRVDVHGREGRVAAGVRVERALAHKAVDAGFGAKRAVGPFALDVERAGLDAGDFARAFFFKGDLEALAFGVAHVHAFEHARPVLGLGAACACLDFQVAVGRVHRLVEHALEFELSNLLLDFLNVLAHGFNRVPVFFGHREFEKLGSIVDARGELVEAADDVVEELLFLAHFLSMLGIVPEIRVLNLAVDFFETARFAIDVKDTPEVRSDGA